jgi:uncharacterized membrane protein YphA (DoxX/SURF4 family)
LWPTAAFELGAGVLLLVGQFTRPVALLLAGFSIVTALIFHSHFADQIQMIMFLKNVAMTGGFLMIAKNGASGFSLDALRTRRAMVQHERADAGGGNPRGWRSRGPEGRDAAHPSAARG